MKNYIALILISLSLISGTSIAHPYDDNTAHRDAENQAIAEAQRAQLEDMRRSSEVIERQNERLRYGEL